MDRGEERLHAAVASSALAGEAAQRELFQSICDVARAIFDARAASITRFDALSDQLVFEAVSGEGSDSLVGSRFPSDQGLAGFVLASREPLVIEDVEADRRFSRELAEQTGYVPRALMAAPLLRGDEALGVLSVLDRSPERAHGLAEIDLLALFSRQASIALEVIERARAAGSVLEGKGETAVVARLAASLEGLEGERRDASLRLLEVLEELLGT